MSAAKVQRKATEAYQQSLDEVLAAHITDPGLGLSQAEAQARREKFGRNEALVCGAVITAVASCGNLRTFFAASVFDGKLKHRRLALLRRCSKLGALGVRIEQDDYTPNCQQSFVTNTTE